MPISQPLFQKSRAGECAQCFLAVAVKWIWKLLTRSAVCACVRVRKNSTKLIFRAVYRELHAQMPSCLWDFCILRCHESRLSRLPSASHRRVFHSSVQRLCSAPSLSSGFELVNHAACTLCRYHSWKECSFTLSHLSAQPLLPKKAKILSAVFTFFGSLFCWFFFLMRIIPCTSLWKWTSGQYS